MSSVSSVSTAASVQTVSAAQRSAAAADLVRLAAAAVSLQAPGLQRLLFVCPVHVRVSTDPTQSVFESGMLPVAPLSPSWLSLHTSLQQATIHALKTISYYQ